METIKIESNNMFALESKVSFLEGGGKNPDWKASVTVAWYPTVEPDQ